MEVTRRIGLPACILALALAGTARSAENTIAILGSSTAAGVGASTYDSAFAGRYAKYLGGLKPSWKLVNLAVGGYTTYHIMPTGWKRPAGRPAPDTARNITKVSGGACGRTVDQNRMACAVVSGTTAVLLVTVVDQTADELIAAAQSVSDGIGKT